MYIAFILSSVELCFSIMCLFVYAQKLMILKVWMNNNIIFFLLYLSNNVKSKTTIMYIFKKNPTRICPQILCPTATSGNLSWVHMLKYKQFGQLEMQHSFFHSVMCCPCCRIPQFGHGTSSFFFFFLLLQRQCYASFKVY